MTTLHAILLTLNVLLAAIFIWHVRSLGRRPDALQVAVICSFLVLAAGEAALAIRGGGSLESASVVLITDLVLIGLIASLIRTQRHTRSTARARHEQSLEDRITGVP